MRTVDDFASLGQWIKHYYFDQLTVLPNEKSVRKILEDNPKLVWAVSHGPGFAPAFINVALLDILLKNGGADRKMLSIAWKPFYKVPILKQLTKHFSQLEKPSSCEEIIDIFSNQAFTDFIVYPEGENSIFGNGKNIEDFKSPRFLEVAIECETPVLIVAHYGSQNSAKTIDLTEKQSQWIRKVTPEVIQKLAKPGTIYLPSFKKSKTDEFKVSFKLYHPKLTKDTLPKDDTEKKKALEKEALQIRKTMQKMLDALI